MYLTSQVNLSQIVILSLDEEDANDLVLRECKQELKRSLIFRKKVFKIDLGGIEASKAIFHHPVVDFADLYAFLANSYELIATVILMRKQVHAKMGVSSGANAFRFFSAILSC